MTTLAQLPPAPPGTQYRLRHIVETHPTRGRRTDKPKGVYCTTGVFETNAEHAKGSALVKCAALILDFDLCDYLAPGSDRKTKAQAKLALYGLTDEQLDGYLKQHKDTVEQTLYAAGLPKPSSLVVSGYGLHAYYWIDDSTGYGEDIQLAVKANSGLVALVNKTAGYTLADPACFDSGTRILRVPYTFNNKADAPRQVRILYVTGERFNKERLFYLATLSTVEAAYAADAPRSYSHLPRATVPVEAATQGAQASHTGIAAYIEQLPAKQLERLRVIITSCPFFLWATENPTALSRESWRGAATNIAAIAGEPGREVFHDFSALDPDRYSETATDILYTDALESAETVGPMTYATLANNGDWPGPASQPFKAPAAYRFDPVVEATGLIDLALDAKGRPLRTKGNLRKLLRVDEKYGDRLRWNEAAQIVEHDGEPITDVFYGVTQEHLEDAYNMPFLKNVVADALDEIAYDNRYHPVATYLNNLSWDGKTRIPELIGDILGVADPTGIYYHYIKCWLVSAVARGLCNDAQGVQVDTVLVLHGHQGIGKSTFFRVMANGWYNSTEIKVGDKDALIALAGAWFIEWQEIERVLRRNPEGAKSFITRQVDVYRRPYARTEIRVPRRCVICASTNAPDFLTADPTGSRRYLVISIPYTIHQRSIATTKLKGIRDQLWAEAVALYKAGTQWHLTPEQAETQIVMNNNFSAELPWQSLIQGWVIGKDSKEIITTERILGEAVQKPTEQWSSKDFHLVRSVMRAMGWKSARKVVTATDALTGESTTVRKYVWVPDKRSPLFEKPKANPPINTEIAPNMFSRTANKNTQVAE